MSTLGRATKLPARSRLKRQAEVFKALGHPGRMAIVHALAREPVCACDLAGVARLSASTTSRHLTGLRHAGVIRDERRGQKIFYHLSYPCVLSFAECLERIDAGEQVDSMPVACCSS